MTREKMLTRIAENLDVGTTLTINVSHGGKYTGVYMYEVTSNGYTYMGHKWTRKSCGDLRAYYRIYVIDRR